MQEVDSSLSKPVERLGRALERQNSLGRRFLSGLVFGLGSVLGAAIFGALAVYVVTQILQSVGWESLIQDTVNDFVKGQTRSLLR